MRTDIPVPTEQAYQKESETQSEQMEGHDFIAPEDAGPFEVILEDQVGLPDSQPEEDAPNPRRRGPDRDPESSLHRHITHCTICNHPEREAIEECILHWHSPTVIADEFDLGDRRVVWRHARAFGLSQLRAEQTRHALGYLIEQAQSVFPSADAIIRAVRALACLDDQGRWHEPRKEVVITHRYEEVTDTNNETSGSREESEDALSAYTEPSERARTECSESARRGARPRGGRHNHRHRQSTRSLGGRSFSSDKQATRISEALAPEAKRPSLLRRLFSASERGGQRAFPGTRAEKSSA